MNLTDYRRNAKRTCKDLGSLLLNSQHMTDGFVSEAGEILECIKLKSQIDLVNLAEEIGDSLWYAANYATLYELELDMFIFASNLYHTDKYQMGQNLEPYDLMQIYSAQLLDMDKKELAYGKVKDLNVLKDTFAKYMMAISDTCYVYGLDAEKIMGNNIAKLKIRYPEKFNSFDAINRDLEAERKELEK